MQTFIALLRGINVGGHNKLPMAELRELCDSIGFKETRTYIQSGNIVFCSDGDSKELSLLLEAAIEKQFGFRPPVLVITAAELKAAAEDYPFSTENHKHAHIMFLGEQPNKVAVVKLKGLEQEPDKLLLGEKALFSYYPNGVLGAKTDLNKIERALNVTCTSRNWRTVQKLIEMSS